MRYLKMTLAYDGTDYVGWQVQPNGVSIQQVLETAWHSVTGETQRITASGRTDSGVHALGQVCSLATESSLSCHRLTAALNAHLPEDIRLLSIENAPVNFHAIRDATEKTYRYAMQHGPRCDLFRRRYCWHVRYTLNVEAMQAAARHLTGTHDFSAFQSTGAARLDAIRSVRRLDITDRATGQFRDIEIEIAADGFLYNMVRNIVGTLVMTGRGKWSPQRVRQILDGRDRTAAGPTAPPHGLFLMSVRYDRSAETGEAG